jgi:Lipocalin-like domain
LQRKQILGAWRLDSFEARDVATGIVRRPLGEDPSGLILYTDDGYMAARLATTPSGSDYVAYGGRFHLDEQTSVVHHEVTTSMMPELLAAPQYRRVRVDGDLLTLSATMTDDDGVTLESTLVWRRAPDNGRSSVAGHS